MKALFAGLGSIGCRHIKNFSEELSRRGVDFTIDALRSSGRPLADGIDALLSRSYSSPDELDGSYDVVFVTNPTSLHAATISSLICRAGAMFIEKPVFIDPATDISSLGVAPDCVCYVACPLRHSSAVKRASQLVRESRVSAARALCSSYLPEWRKTGDYRECYSAHRDLGGGVRLDLVHEWDYLVSLFDFPLDVRAFSGHFSPLEISSDDVAVYIARYPELLLSLHLDYIGRAPRRELELYCEDETYIVDIIKNEVLSLRSGKREELPPCDIYKSEMSYFVDCVQNCIVDNMNTIDRAARVLSLAAVQE
ncbi:MAG: Gfo/Idh/MocA family oxidoreductase [Oscillospiraceae bacterium]